ncbi:MAG: hypothetical protein QNJ55_17480 [Xenococcus sp. MO_188.B8]|nr:hypothetical protein [Xenococcus sp. MO_188.B8]
MRYQTRIRNFAASEATNTQAIAPQPRLILRVEDEICDCYVI